jgi:hypothetical protein
MLARHRRPARGEGEVNDTDARPLAPAAPHQPRPARDAPDARERGGVVAGQGRVMKAIALRSQIWRRGGAAVDWMAMVGHKPEAI